jgi:hypothetical protein
MEMRELDRWEIEDHVEHARRMRSEACGELIAAAWGSVGRRLAVLARRVLASVRQLPVAR